jgi:hypothetical protein
LPILGQLLNFIPSEIFKEVVEEEKADRYYKKLRTWALLTLTPRFQKTSQLSNWPIF